MNDDVAARWSCNSVVQVRKGTNCFRQVESNAMITVVVENSAPESKHLVLAGSEYEP